MSYLESDFEGFQQKATPPPALIKPEHQRKPSLTTNEKPERLSLKDKLDKSRKTLI